jgi:hypothetical protein
MFKKIIFTFLIGLSAQAQNLCETYLRKNHQLSCDQKNYLTQYGYRYCQEFQKQQFRFSSYGQRVLTGIRACLVRFVSETEGLTCQNIKELSMRSHVRCYLSAGYCGLSWVDKMRLLYVIRAEVRDPQTYHTYQLIRQSCVVVARLKR